jgi:CRISPR type III-A-associated RAMP protein Csm4
MPSAIVRFRPTGPWRFGPDSGSRDRVDLIYHSDSLYAAVTGAMLRLELLDEWLDSTVRKTNAAPDVRFSSLYPFQRDHLFVPPPRSMWPPPPSTKVRFKSARFVPLSVVQALVADQTIDDNRWIVDGECQCMIPSGEGPFRIGLRTAAGIDRLNPAATDPHTTACIEFGRDAGLWTMVVFSTDEARERWQRRVASAFRLLADSGFGGERSLGWGRSEDPRWKWSPEVSFEIAPETPVGYWLLSLYAPAGSDAVDWKTGNYTTATRTGRVESATNWGALKSPTVMIAEGSVIVATAPPYGEARDVAPPDFPHPVYRSGFAVAIPVPWRAPGTPRPEPRPKLQPVAEPVLVSAEPAPTPEPTPPGPQPDTAPAAEPEPQTPAPTAEPEAAPPEPEPRPPTPTLEPEAAPAPEQEPDAPTPSPQPEAPVPPEPEPEITPLAVQEPQPPTPTPDSEPEFPPEAQERTPVPQEPELDRPRPTTHNPQPAGPGGDQ